MEAAQWTCKQCLWRINVKNILINESMEFSHVDGKTSQSLTSHCDKSLHQIPSVFLPLCLLQWLLGVLQMHPTNPDCVLSMLLWTCEVFLDIGNGSSFPPREHWPIRNSVSERQLLRLRLRPRSCVRFLSLATLQLSTKMTWNPAAWSQSMWDVVHVKTGSICVFLF